MAARTLEHLIIEPYNGLCNRIRVIAAAEALCRLVRGPLHPRMELASYESLFEPEPTIEIVNEFPVLPAGHLRLQPGLDRWVAPHQRLPLDAAACIAITTCHSLGSTADLHYLGMHELLPWLPQPAAAIREKARQFRERMFPPAGSSACISGAPIAIGRSSIHRIGVFSTGSRPRRFRRPALPRHRQPTHRIPNDRALRRQAADLSEEPGHAKTLATGADLAETIEDYADLLVLAGCDYVLGSQQSSFSDLAIALNGSSQSTQIECLPTGRLTADEQRQRMMDGFARLPVYLRQIRRVVEPRIGIGRAVRKLLRGLRR